MSNFWKKRNDDGLSRLRARFARSEGQAFERSFDTLIAQSLVYDAPQTASSANSRQVRPEGKVRAACRCSARQLIRCGRFRN